MFCPRCGSIQNAELKFCKSCGANLYAVRQVVDTRETGEKFDWSKTWVAQMFQSEEEAQRRKAELDRQRGLTPEVKRYIEIKAGVITASAGLALGIVIFFFMQGLILSGRVSSDTAEILGRLWIAGVIPLFIGIAFIVNGWFISRKMVEVARRNTDPGALPLQPNMNRDSLPEAEANHFIPSDFSVTEETTRSLRRSGPKK